MEPSILKSTILATFFGFALLVALATGGYFVFKYVVDVFATLDPPFASLAAIASVVALLCAAIIAGGLRERGRTENCPLAMMQRAKLYERLLTLCCEQVKGREDGNPQRTMTNLPEIERALALHGSAKVVAAYNNFRRLRRQDGQPAEAITAMLSKLVAEIRKDLGRTDLMRDDKDLHELLSE
jgi:hypothetical protein